MEGGKGWGKRDEVEKENEEWKRGAGRCVKGKGWEGRQWGGGRENSRGQGE